MVGFPGGTFLPLPPLLSAVQWDLETIDKHDACPEEGAHIAQTTPCFWCFALHQAEWNANVFSDMESRYHELSIDIGLMRKAQPGRWTLIPDMGGTQFSRTVASTRGKGAGEGRSRTGGQ